VKANLRQFAASGRLILETQSFGLVALLPIGMSPISSVTFEAPLKAGVEVHKGDMMGHFLFGGSDFVMLFQPGYECTFDAPRQAGSGKFPHLLMGERLGRLRRLHARGRSINH
jgi:hypothetical protein